MIVSKLIGGLGNQMFQYACGRAVALRTGQEFKLDIAGYENQNPLDTKRDYELGIFKISSQFSTSTECQMLKGRNGGILEISAKIHFPLLSRYIFKDKNTYFFENIQQKFEDRILNLSGNAYLDGWWQSEKYFMDFKDQIIKDFTFKDKILSEYKKYLEDIKKGGCLSLYVRCGDYRTKYQNYFYQLDADYYNNAIKLINNKAKIRKIYIICEDLMWPKKNIKTKIPWVNIFEKDDQKHWQSLMQLMTLFEYQIIHNGSYSWWPAYLSKNPNKIIIAPKKWFYDKNMNVASRVPKKWITI